ncbi:hypothetical protein [Parafrankia sp. EAN1pec]|uniref:hypothetical protein n=1 Tax=Parafrankia sp. (strain EAN1pec) TaxID=298653 RepID=UPI00321A3613
MSNAVTPAHALAVQLRRRLSAERPDPYERACNHDLERAVALYEWNSSISASEGLTSGTTTRPASSKPIDGRTSPTPTPGRGATGRSSRPVE